MIREGERQKEGSGTMSLHNNISILVLAITVLYVLVGANLSRILHCCHGISFNGGGDGTSSVGSER